MLKYITRTVWVLSIISFLNDAASDLLYPVLPIYLKSIGYSVVIIGIMEGIAELVAGFSKGYFGKWSDHTAKRKPFVQLGYALSALSKPMLIIFAYPAWVFFSRSLDKLGKGLRTGARDAILSDEATPQTKGKVFGFHRSMDTFGAVLGPTIALIYLHFYPKDYINLILITIIPGLLTVLSTFFIKEKKREPKPKGEIKKLFIPFSYWRSSSANYKKLVIGLLVFTLFNSSDVFLLLKAKEAGLDDTGVIGVYIFFNLIYALFAFPIGILADKIGLKKVFIIGLIIFATVYGCISLCTNLYFFGVLFFLYGIFAACSEGISKAWISNIVDKKDTATAIGGFSGFQSVSAFFASALTGFIWYQFGSMAAFLTISGVTFCVIVYFIVAVPYKKA